MNKRVQRERGKHQVANASWQWLPIVHDPNAELPWEEDGTEEQWENAATWRADIDRVNALPVPKLTRLQRWLRWQDGLKREQEQALAMKHARLDAEYMAIVRG